jgi:hypothetical protein
MTIRPDMLTTPQTPEARGAAKYGDLERRLSALERKAVAGIQRESAANLTNEHSNMGLTWKTPSGGPTITVQVPSLDSLVFIDWSLELKKQGGSAADICVAASPASEDPAFAVDGIYFTYSTVFTRMSPWVATYTAVNTGALFPAAKRAVIVTGEDLQNLGLTVPGQLTFGFLQRAEGGTTIAYTRKRRLRIVVI